MLPSHAESQSQAATALPTAVDLQGLALPVEMSRSETLNDAETTVKAVNHPLDQHVSLLLVQVPEPDFRALDAPFPSDHLQVFG